MKLLQTLPVERPCGGLVELFEIPRPIAGQVLTEWAVRFTHPENIGADDPDPDKDFAVGRMKSQRVAEAVARNWARGTTDVPWASKVNNIGIFPEE